MTGQELAGLAMKAVDAVGYSDFARKLGLDGSHQDRRVKRWVEGTNEPDFDGTVRMLRAAGMLRSANGAAEAAPPSFVPVPGSAEALLVEIQREVEKGFEKLARRLGRLEKRLLVSAAPVPPRQQKAV